VLGTKSGRSWDVHAVGNELSKTRTKDWNKICEGRGTLKERDTYRGEGWCGLCSLSSGTCCQQNHPLFVLVYSIV